jgi:hypothetical protein
MARIYSPSSTLDFATCPLKWALRRFAHIVPRYIGKKECAAAVGIGFAEGVHAFYKGLPVIEAIDTARYTAERHIDTLLTSGGLLSDDDNVTASRVGQRAATGVERYIAWTATHDEWWDPSPELTFPDYGPCRVDLVVNTCDGPTIIDFKTRVTNPRSFWMIDQQLDESEQSWQLKHYVWAARENGMEIEAYGIAVVVLEPRWSIHLSQWAVDEEEMKHWYGDAMTLWSRMEALERLVECQGLKALRWIERSPTHYTKYGICDYYSLCFNFKLEIERAKSFYMLQEKR